METGTYKGKYFKIKILTLSISRRNAFCVFNINIKYFIILFEK